MESLSPQHLSYLINMLPPPNNESPPPSPETELFVNSVILDAPVMPEDEIIVPQPEEEEININLQAAINMNIDVVIPEDENIENVVAPEEININQQAAMNMVDDVVAVAPVDVPIPVPVHAVENLDPVPLNRNKRRRETAQAKKKTPASSRKRRRRMTDEEMNERPDWLPETWTMTAKRRSPGSSTIDRKYYDTVSETILRSAKSVKYFLRTGKKPKSKTKKNPATTSRSSARCHKRGAN